MSEPEQKLSEADLKDAVIVQWHGTEALPRGMCVVVQHKEGTSAVIWVGAANMIPDHAWEPGTTINVDPLTFSVVKAKSAEREKGVPRP